MRAMQQKDDETAVATPGKRLFVRRAASEQGETPRTGWKQLLDVDFLYGWATLLLIPAYAINTRLRSQIVVIYAILFVLKVWKSGYRKCGLEIYFAIAILGLAVSYIGSWQSEVLKNVVQVAKIACLPILMSQYRPVRDIEKYLACIFTGLAVYGVVRMGYAPLVTGYAKDRPYCYSDFFMHSSVIAFSGYLFFLVMLIRQEGFKWKLLSALNVILFTYLIVLHNVRGSYLAFMVITPLILVLEFRKRALIGIGAVVLCAVVLACGIGILRPELADRTTRRVRSILDVKEGSNEGRLVIWKKAVQVFAANPVNGIGYRRFNMRNMDLGDARYGWSFAHAHNEFLQLLAETGLIGLLAWLAFKIRFLVIFFKARAHWVGAFMLYLLLAFEFHNIFECYIYERIAYIYIFVLLGLGLNQLLGMRESVSRPGAER